MSTFGNVVDDYQWHANAFAGVVSLSTASIVSSAEALQSLATSLSTTSVFKILP